MREAAEPQYFILGWRLLNIMVLLHIWIIGDSTASSFILILLLLFMGSLRWRFYLPAWTAVFDIFFCLLYFPAAISHYGLAIPLFELVLKGKWVFFLLLLASSVILLPSLEFIIWYFLAAFLFGSFAYAMRKNQQIYRKEMDELRKAKYELERLKSDLLKAGHSTSQHAQLLERNRIARQLHDHLGHDLTGASLAVQAYEHVEDPKEAKKLLEEVKCRIERSTIHLRETVHNMSTTAMAGVERMDKIVDDFPQFDIHFKKYGDMNRVPAFIWTLLESCLKEAVTNTARHSDATNVMINLQVTDTIVRVSIQDNGSNENQKMQRLGSGLRSLQLRTRALDGNLSISNDDGFLVVCVLPLKEGEDN